MTMICSTLPELLDDDAAWRCVQAGIPAVAGLRTGLACAAALLRRSRRPGAARGRSPRRRAPARHPGEPDGEWLSEHDAKELLRAGGVDVVAGRLVTDADDAALALSELGGTSRSS